MDTLISFSFVLSLGEAQPVSPADLSKAIDYWRLIDDAVGPVRLGSDEKHHPYDYAQRTVRKAAAELDRRAEARNRGRG